MKQGDEPVNPLITQDQHIDRLSKIAKGLTKREYFAALAFQGFAAMPDKGGSFSDMDEAIKQMAEVSVKCADALLTELNK